MIRSARAPGWTGVLVLVVVGCVSWWTEWLLCPFRWITGVPCPGCGLTRAVVSLMRGDVVGALHFHPLVFVVMWVLGLWVWGMLFGGQRLRPWMTISTVALLLLVWWGRLTGWMPAHPDNVDMSRGLIARAGLWLSSAMGL